MLILNASDLQKALPMKTTIGEMKHAYAALSAGEAVVPLRARINLPDQEAAGLFMPAYVPASKKDKESASAFAVKIVTLFPKNVPAGMPLIHAAVVVMDAKNGRMLALLEGGTLTAIRTGAGAGIATEILARADCRVAAIFGAGVQARTQLEAICAVRDIKKVWVFARNHENVTALITEMSDRVSAMLVPAPSPRQALLEADIVCTATTSKTPVFSDTDLKPGTHINGIGSYTPEMIEIPPRTVARARTVVDSRAACQAEAGEIIRAVEQGWVLWENTAEIGEIILGQQPGRTSPQQITFFKSVGIAVQDAVAAQLALENARTLGLGQEVDW